MGLIFLVYFSIFGHMCFGELEYSACLYENNIWTANNIHDQCRIWCPELNTCYEPCVAEVTKDMVKIKETQVGRKLSSKKRRLELNTACQYENTLWSARLIYDHCRRWCPHLNTCYEPCVEGLTRDLIDGKDSRPVLLNNKRVNRKHCKPK